MSVNLATQLREGTKTSHTMAENVGFVRCFLRGVVEKNSYRKLVADLYFVYSAMEEEFDRLKDHPVVSKIYFPLLHRKASLEKDLQYYFGSEWKSTVKASKPAQKYVDRIHQVAQESPELLVAHSYTRYLGDLSGGQILKKIAVNAMNLNDGVGTAFYEFPEIDDEKAFKDMYRAAMNDLPIEQEAADRIVEEANDAFGRNMEMFKELEGNLIKAIGVMVFNSLNRRRSKGSTMATSAS